MCNVVEEQIDTTIKIFRSTLHPQGCRIKCCGRKYCCNHAIHHTLDDKWPTDKRIVCTNETHNGDFFTRHIDCEANSIEGNHNRNNNQHHEYGERDALDAFCDCGQLIDNNFILAVIYVVDEIGSRPRCVLFVFDVLGNRLVLRCILCLNVQNCTKWIVDKLFERLRHEIVVVVPCFKIQYRLITRNIFNGFYFRHTFKRALHHKNICLLCIGVEVHIHIYLAFDLFK